MENPSAQIPHVSKSGCLYSDQTSSKQKMELDPSAYASYAFVSHNLKPNIYHRRKSLLFSDCQQIDIQYLTAVIKQINGLEWKKTIRVWDIRRTVSVFH